MVEQDSGEYTPLPAFQGRPELREIRRRLRTKIWEGYVLFSGIALILAIATFSFPILLLVVGLNSKLDRVDLVVALFLLCPSICWMMINNSARQVFSALTRNGGMSDGLRISLQNYPGFASYLRHLEEASVAPPCTTVDLSDGYLPSVNQVTDTDLKTHSQLSVGSVGLCCFTPEQHDILLLHALTCPMTDDRLISRADRMIAALSVLLQPVKNKRNPDNLPFFRRLALSIYMHLKCYASICIRHQVEVSDAIAARRFGARAVAETLICAELTGQFTRNFFWPIIFSLVNEQSKPPADLYDQLQQTILPQPSAGQWNAWLEESLTRMTEINDQVPALADRLKLLQYSVHEEGGIAHLAMRCFPHPEQNAMLAYFSTDAADLTTRLNDCWREDMEARWAALHAEYQDAARTIDELSEITDRPLTKTEAWQRLKCAMILHCQETVYQSYLQELVERNPRDWEANLCYGAFLLRQQNPRGIQYLEQAMEENPAFTPECCQEIINYLQDNDDVIGGHAYRKRMMVYEKHADIALGERFLLTPFDHFLPHDLPAEELSEIRAVIAQLPGITTAYLARKKIRFSNKPVYVIVLIPRFWAQEDRFYQRVLTSTLRAHLPEENDYIIRLSFYPWLTVVVQTIRRVQGARIVP